MPNYRSLLSPFSNLFSQKQLIKLTSRKVFSPFYHAVSDVSLPHIKHLYQVRGSKTFIQDLEYLCQHYSPIGIDELLEITKSEKPISKPVFHLTFDDGLSQFYDVIAPILKHKGIPATVFLNYAFIDNEDLFYRYKVSLLIEALLNSKQYSWAFDGQIFKEKSQIIAALKKSGYHQTIQIDELAVDMNVSFDAFLREKQPYMTSEQIKELYNQGFSFGGHSINHPMFNKISVEEQKRQVSECFEALEVFNLDNKYFSFPFNDEGVTKEFFSWLYDDEGCALSFGISGLKDDAFKQHLHRFPMEGSLTNAKNLIKTEYLYFLMKGFMGKNIVTRA